MHETTATTAGHRHVPREQPLAAARGAPPLHGLLAQFDSPQTLVEACERIRDAGFTRWDAHSPYPIHGIDDAIGIRMTRLPFLVFAFGLTGCLTGIALQWWANAANPLDFSWIPTFVQGYAFRSSGKPYWSFPANIPVIFELTVLFSAFGAFFGMLMRNNLALFAQPLLRSSRFQQLATTDGFFIAIEAADPKFSEARTRQLLESLGAVHIERVEQIPEEPLRSPWAKRAAIVTTVAALIPPVLIAKAWVSRTETPRIHIIQDMDNQEKYKAQAAMPLFADGRAMRPPVTGTVARGELRLDDHLYRGIVNGQYATTFPTDAGFVVNEAFIRRGQERFVIYCAPCHGLDGSGRGPVNQRALELNEAGGSWVQAADLADEERRSRPLGHLYNTITNGIRTMPAYADKLRPEDRWAVVAYIRALQRARYAPVEELPADLVEQLEGR